jgi:ketosteroid isomerase-like protein
LASQAYDKALQLDSSNAAAQNKLALVRELVGGAPRGATAGAKPPARPPVVVAAAEPPKPAAPAAEAKPAAPPAPAAAAKPAAPAPAAAAEKPAAKPAAAGSEEILQMLNAWAAAWSKKNVDAYLAFYARDFKTPNGEARADWEQGRRVRIQAPKSISVDAEAPKVSLSGDKQASVTFRQKYKSDTLSANSMKTLVLVKTDAGWRIQQERVGN